jgi:hypothetical protein
MFSFPLKGKAVFLFSVYLKFLHRITILNFVAENSEVKLAGNSTRGELKLISKMKND